MDINSVILIISAVAVISAAVFAYFIGKKFAPWMPSNRKMVIKALDYIKPTKDMKFVDLGCGDGRVVFLAQRRYRFEADGFELSPIPYFVAILRRFFYPYKSARIYFKNLFSVPLQNYDIIYIFGLADTVNDKIIDKLNKEVKPGAYVVSYYFSFDTKKPLVSFKDKWRTMHVYKF